MKIGEALSRYLEKNKDIVVTSVPTGGDATRLRLTRHAGNLNCMVHTIVDIDRQEEYDAILIKYLEHGENPDSLTVFTIESPSDSHFYGYKFCNTTGIIYVSSEGFAYELSDNYFYYAYVHNEAIEIGGNKLWRGSNGEWNVWYISEDDYRYWQTEACGRDAMHMNSMKYPNLVVKPMHMQYEGQLLEVFRNLYRIRIDNKWIEMDKNEIDNLVAVLQKSLQDDSFVKKILSEVEISDI